MKFEEKRDVYADIATLYYLGDLDQNEIAKIYNISRYKVSRILKTCRSKKIVTFNINRSSTRRDSISEELKDRLGLDRVIIVPAGSTEEDSKNNVGIQAASYLSEIMHDGMKIGMSWGSTVQTVAKNFSAPEGVSDITFVQLTGSVCSSSISEKGYQDGAEIIRTMALKLPNRCYSSTLPVPYVVDQPQVREMLMRESMIAQHFSLYDHLDAVCLGVGSCIAEKSCTYISGYITLAQSQKMIDDGNAADISGIRLAGDGSVAHTILDNRVMSISPESLKNVPVKIAAASGTDKITSLTAGIAGNYINIIVIDDVTALALIDHLDNS